MSIPDLGPSANTMASAERAGVELPPTNYAPSGHAIDLRKAL